MCEGLKGAGREECQEGKQEPNPKGQVEPQKGFLRKFDIICFVFLTECTGCIVTKGGGWPSGDREATWEALQ